ncbi:LptA/OstA family protein [Brevundimonas sp.]|uniref:LptA/OstA family protein n=1 Tax=Brevundimonas sp. TaxID=1871086 RepID=UPI0025F0B4EF|nr:LptA/OstA family protein [Brevundimonas sp.]
MRLEGLPLKRILTGAAVAATAAALLGGAALAQIARDGGPIAMGADRLEVIDAEGVQIWSGRAEAVQGENRLRADVIRAFHARRQGPSAPNDAPGSNLRGDIERMVATGNVYFVTPTQVVRGDEATYTRSTDTIVVTGDVILTQGENVLTGSRLTVQVASGRATMDGAPTAAGQRVRGVFYPDE